jgi:hypothetical protein
MNEVIARLATLGAVLNANIDHGETAEIAAVRDRITDGKLLSWLQGNYSGLSTHPAEVEEAILNLFRSFSYPDEPRRNFGIDRNGLALIVTYCFEGIKQLNRA